MNILAKTLLATSFLALALPAGAAFADATVKLSIAGEAYDGPPAFQISMGGKVIGKGVLDKAISTETVGRLFASAKPASYLQEFTFTIPERQFKPDASISVILTNDKYRDEEIGRDRNLFVQSITVNGQEVDAAQLILTVSDKPEIIDFQAGYLPVYQTRDAAVAEPPAGGWPLVDVGVDQAMVTPVRVTITPLPVAQ